MVTVIVLDYRERKIPLCDLGFVSEDPRVMPYLDVIQEVAERTGPRGYNFNYSQGKDGKRHLTSIQLNSDSDEHTNAFIREIWKKRVGLDTVVDSIELHYFP